MDVKSFCYWRFQILTSVGAEMSVTTQRYVSITRVPTFAHVKVVRGERIPVVKVRRKISVICYDIAI